MMDRLFQAGWRAVEFALLLIALCILLNVILGADSGPLIASVSGNAQNFLKAIPSGSLLGIVILVLLYQFFKARAGK